MFYSGNFMFNKIYSSEYNICLVSENSDILNNYGVSFDSLSDKNEITLSFTHADENNEPLAWSEDVLMEIYNWFITKDHKPFISEDNEDIIYFMKGIKISKRLNCQLLGFIDVTFDLYSPFGYKEYRRTITDTSKKFVINNVSNVDSENKPKITLSNFKSEKITISNLTTKKEPFEISVLDSDYIVIDNSMGTITNDKGINMLMNSNRRWISLCKLDNVFKVDGICTIEFETYYPQMV